jgi:phage terminase large subunit-like protein
MNATTKDNASRAEKLASLPEKERALILNDLTDAETEAMLNDWHFWARKDQLPPDWNWNTWLALAGRGWGKTRVGSEFIRSRVETAPRIALIGRTTADVRDTMIEGESGLINVFPKHQKPDYQANKARVVFHTGAVAHLYSSKEPDQLRGPQHYLAWGDELASWYYPDEVFYNLMLGLRLGDNPQTLFTTTPRPIKIIQDFLKDKTAHVTTGSTYANKANLPNAFISNIIERYEGTTIGRQELHAEVLNEVEGALWKQPLIDKNRVRLEELPELERIVVAVDPATTSKKNSDETGILVVGLGLNEKKEKQGYVLDDYSLIASPKEWAQKVAQAYYDYEADSVIGEVNQGGEMVKYTLETVDDTIPFKSIHASRGKKLRAEPIVSLYEKDFIKHLGNHAKLESQMTSWVPDEGDSPDRVDALVWGIWELFIAKKKPAQVRAARTGKRRR